MGLKNRSPKVLVCVRMCVKLFHIATEITFLVDLVLFVSFCFVVKAVLIDWSTH